MPITWDESTPSDGAPLSQGAAALRAFKAALAEGVSPSMYWPGSGGGSAASAGVMKPGSFRMLTGVSGTSLNDTAGILVLSDVTNAVYVTSASVVTQRAMAARHLECDGLNPLSNATKWTMCTGETATGDDGAVAFSVVYASAPMVFVSQVSSFYSCADPSSGGASGRSAANLILSSVTTGGFIAKGYFAGTSGSAECSGQTINWLSLGTV